MLKKIKNIILQIDRLLYKKFGSDKSTKFLENLKEAQTIFSYLNEIGEENKVKFVGGCVRKVICGENIDDIDLATTHRPDEIKIRLNQKDIKVVDNGLSHGTVTAILNEKKLTRRVNMKESYIVIHDGEQDNKVISKLTPKQSRYSWRWTSEKLKEINMWREQRYPNVRLG